MAAELRLRSIDDADEALQPRLDQPAPQGLITVETKHEARYARVVAEPLIAIAMRGLHLFDFHLAVPFGRRRNGAGVRAEADEGGIAAEAFAAELADVQLAA